MPYKSAAQRGWAHTPAGTEALGGPAKVAEWDAASKGLHVPQYAAPAGTDRGNWERGKTSYKAYMGRQRRGISSSVMSQSS